MLSQLSYPDSDSEAYNLKGAASVPFKLIYGTGCVFLFQKKAMGCTGM
jgi:hypothetical protein